jgi:hypothetical protein
VQKNEDEQPVIEDMATVSKKQQELAPETRYRQSETTLTQYSDYTAFTSWQFSCH